MNLGGAFPPLSKTPTNFGGLVSVPKNTPADSDHVAKAVTKSASISSTSTTS